MIIVFCIIDILNLYLLIIGIFYLIKYRKKTLLLSQNENFIITTTKFNLKHFNHALETLMMSVSIVSIFSILAVMIYFIIKATIIDSDNKENIFVMYQIIFNLFALLIILFCDKICKRKIWNC